MKTKQEVDNITDTLIDFGVKITISTMYLKMLSDIYKDNPYMFWMYKKSKLNNIIYNCRM